MDGLSEKLVVPNWAARKRFNVTDYHRMAQAGVFAEKDRVELIEGEIIEMAPIGGPHIWAVMSLHRLLFLAASDRFWVSVQNSLRLNDFSEPEPDLVLLSLGAKEKLKHQPPPVEDAVLVIQVVDSSLLYDRQVKVPLYARNLVPELWIVDIAGSVIEVFREPSGGSYSRITRFGRGEQVNPLCLPGAQIAVVDVISG